MTETTEMTPQDRRKANVRLGLILGSIAIAFFVGFLVKMTMFSA